MDKMEKLSNPQKTIEVLQKYNFSFQKKFGQNFLIDPHVLDKIIAAAEITKDDFVLEIGPGGESQTSGCEGFSHHLQKQQRKRI